MPSLSIRKLRATLRVNLNSLFFVIPAAFNSQSAVERRRDDEIMEFEWVVLFLCLSIMQGKAPPMPPVDTGQS